MVPGRFFIFSRRVIMGAMPRHFRTCENSRYHTGFTLVEVVITMMIMVTISGIVLVSFTGLHEGTAVNRSARELALALRQAQNMSLAVAEVDTRAGPKIPGAVGVRVGVGLPIYFLFADLTRDNKYDPGSILTEPDTKIGSDRVFEGGARVSALTYSDDLGQTRSLLIAQLMFLVPDASILMTDQDGNQIGDTLHIEIASGSGALKKNVTIRTSGQISIQ